MFHAVSRRHILWLRYVADDRREASFRPDEGFNPPENYGMVMLVTPEIPGAHREAM